MLSISSPSPVFLATSMLACQFMTTIETFPQSKIFQIQKLYLQYCTVHESTLQYLCLPNASKTKYKTMKSTVLARVIQYNYDTNFM